MIASSGKARHQALPDDVLGLAIGQAHQVLHALMLDLELIAALEEIQGQLAGIAGDGG